MLFNILLSLNILALLCLIIYLFQPQCNESFKNNKIPIDIKESLKGKFNILKGNPNAKSLNSKIKSYSLTK